MFFSNFVFVVLLAFLHMQVSAFHACSNSRQRHSPSAMSTASSRSLLSLDQLRNTKHHPKTTATMLQSQPMNKKGGIFDIAVSKLPQFHWIAPAKKLIDGLSKFTSKKLTLLRSILIIVPQNFHFSPVVAALVLALIPGLAFAEPLKSSSRGINFRNLWFKFGTFIVPFIAGVLACYVPMKEAKNDFFSLLPIAIEKSKIEPVTKRNVKRKGLDDQLAKAGDCIPSDQYFIVYGAKGAGKSHAIDHFFSCREAVIKLMVTTANTKDDVISVISNELLGTESVKLNPNSLIAAVKRSKITPTIIFDVERGGSPDQALGLQAVRSLSKLLAPFCRCFIVLSEASAVLEFSKDTDREIFIFAGEMSIEEAKEFLVQQNCSLADEQMGSVYRDLGGNPAKLKAMSGAIKGGSSIEAFVTSSLLSARTELIAFRHQAILQALKEHPEGVNPEYFNKQKNEGVDLSDPIAVGAAMRGTNVLVYRMELDLYQLQSNVHNTALKTYTPIISFSK